MKIVVTLLVLLLAVVAHAQVPPTGPTGLPLGPSVPGIIQPPTLSSSTSSVTASPDVSTTATLAALNDVVSLALSGRHGAGVSITAGLDALIIAEASFDNGTTWRFTPLIRPEGTMDALPASVSTVTGISRNVFVQGGETTVRVRVITYTSGSATATLTVTAGTATTFPYVETPSLHTFTGDESGLVTIPMQAGANVVSLGGSTFGLAVPSPLRLGGRPFTLRATSAAFTPPAVTATLPPHPVMTFSGNTISATNNYVVDNVTVRVLGAAATAYTIGARLVKRDVLYASTQTAAPVAGAVPTCAALAYTGAANGGGSYTYKYVAVDIWGNEGNLSGASATCSPGANNGETVTMPAVPAGAAGYNLYRTKTGPGATYYFVGRSNTTTFRDITGDSALTLTQGSINGWSTVPTLSTLTQPVELVMEKFVALTGTAPVIISTVTAPATLNNNRVVTIAPGTAVGRYRIPGEVEAKAFLAAPTITTALARDIDTDYGLGGTTQINAAFGDVAVNSFNQSDAAMGGTFVVWGQTLIGVTEQQSILAYDGAAKTLGGIAEGTTLTMKWVAPPVFVKADEVAVEVGAFGTAASVTLEVYVSGRVF